MSNIAAWAIDFIRALNKRPFLIKFLLRIIFGKYAYNEFTQMVKSIHEFCGIDVEYDLYMQEYHKQKALWKWWDVR